MRLIVSYMLFVCHLQAICAQSISIGHTDPASSAILDIGSTTRGVLFPRMTSLERKAIAHPVPGLLVFDVDKHTVYLFDGVAWRPMLFGTTEDKLPALPVRALDGDPGDQFGKTVAIDGDYAVVGCQEDKIGSNSVQGSAYILKRTSGLWEQQVKLTAWDGESEDYFGSSVAIQGNTAVVGAYSDNVNGVYGQGSVYVFVRQNDQWVLQQKLTASDGAESDHFGWAVAIDGDRVVVGAPHHSIGSLQNKGSVYVYKRTGSIWMQEASLSPFAGGSGDYIGSSVAIDGDRIMFGAPGDDMSGYSDVGSAYILRKAGLIWIQEAYLTPESHSNHLGFGDAVALDGAHAIVGSPLYDFSGMINNGLVSPFQFDGNSWIAGTSIGSPAMQEGGYFGRAVSIRGELLVIGEPLSDVDYYNDVGRAWVCRFNGTRWEVVRPINDDSGIRYGNFAYGIGTDGTNVILSAFRKHGDRGEVQLLHIE